MLVAAVLVAVLGAFVVVALGASGAVVVALGASVEVVASVVDNFPGPGLVVVAAAAVGV